MENGFANEVVGANDYHWRNVPDEIGDVEDVIGELQDLAVDDEGY